MTRFVLGVANAAKICQMKREGHSAEDICYRFNVSRSMLYKILDAEKRAEIKERLRDEIKNQGDC